MSRISPEHPLALLLRGLIHDEVVKHVASKGLEPSEAYLTTLLLDFTRTDSLRRVKDAQGSPVLDLSDLLEEGDVTAKAESFEREREVHRHIGDLMLFGLGIYPELVRSMKVKAEALTLDPANQGRSSYAVVSTFDHHPWQHEAATFKQLSEGFEDFTWVLNTVGRKAGFVTG
jgi:hypothetical protein